MIRARLSGFFRGLWRLRHSIRVQLSLWFALVLALVLLVFGAFVYYRQAQDSYDKSATRLAYRLRELDIILRRNVRLRNNWLTFPGDAMENPSLLREYEVIIVSDLEGEVSGEWGPVIEEDAQSLAAGAPLTDSNRIYKEELTSETEGRAIKYLLVTAPVVSDGSIVGWVTLGQPLDVEGNLPRLRLTLILAGSATLIFAVGGGYWLADRAMHPVKAITRTAQSISESDLSRRLNIHTQDELGELAGTFDRMLDRLQAAFNRQRQFTADASHELRTPLTIIGLETGRVLNNGRGIEEYRRALQVVQSENTFMSHLVNELLTLARMDAGQINLKRETLDLSDVALEAAERYTALAEQKGVQLRTGDLPELPIQGDHQFLLQMIGNLVENGIKYQLPGPDRWVNIETGAYRSETQDITANLRKPTVIPSPQLWLRVSDNGPGIAAEHLPHLFDRFYRIDTARSRNPEDSDEGETIPGSGLGLSIVQWIARMHGGEVTVSSTPDQGTIFEVRLPGTDQR